MTQSSASPGAASKFKKLPAPFHGKVRGDGHLEIDQDNNPSGPRISWKPRKSLEPESHDLDRSPGIQNTLTDNWRDRERLLETLPRRFPVVTGAAGKRGGRLSGPVQFIRKMMDFWRLDTADIVSLLGFEPSDKEYIVKVLHGDCELPGRDFKDRVAHLFHIRRTLWSLFRDLDVENEWLREKHSMLQEESAMSLMLEGSMENLLLVAEYVDSAAGVR